MKIQVVEPIKVTLKTWPATPTHDYDAPNPDVSLLAFEITIPANTSIALSVRLIPGNVKATTEILPLTQWSKL